jgi:hypothetical protein
MSGRPQADAQRALEVRHRGERWAMRIGFALGALILSSLLVVTAWASLENATRDDPSRCSSRAARAEVARGGWAEPDRCLYFDARGDPAPSDSDAFAGPVTRSYSDVLDDQYLTLAVVAIAMLLVVVAAVVGWRKTAA